MQETLLRICTRLPTLRRTAALDSFARAVARNVIRESGRSTSRETPVERIPDHGVDDAAFRRPELQEALITALGLLTPREFMVFWLTFVDEYTDGEIASQLQCSIRAVQSGRHRLRRKLLKKLGSDPPADQEFRGGDRYRPSPSPTGV